MDTGKCPAGDASRDRWSTWRYLMRVGSPSSVNEHKRPLPLAVSFEPAQPSDAASAAVVETEVERLRRYLEVS
jgi:hypothetical protein